MKYHVVIKREGHPDQAHSSDYPEEIAVGSILPAYYGMEPIEESDELRCKIYEATVESVEGSSVVAVVK